MHNYDNFADRERSGWTDSSIVDAYVEKFGPITDEVALGLVKQELVKGKDVLDICCGQGTLTGMLVDAGARATGLDFSAEMIVLARKAAVGAKFQEGDVAALPFEDGCFDLVVCNFGMMHIPDQAKALTEISRVLRTDGKFIMATWASPENSPAFGTVFGAIKAHADFAVAPPQPDLFTFARPEDASAMMSTSGLKMVSHETVTPVWVLSAPAELFEIFLTATVGASMLIRGQKPEVITAIGDQITSTVAENFAEGNQFRVPVPVAVVTATPI